MYRSEMLALMERKQRKQKGGGLSRENTFVLSGHLSGPPVTPAAQKRCTEKPIQAPKRSPEKLPSQIQSVSSQDRPERAHVSAPRKMIPVDADGITQQLNIAACNSIDDVIVAIKELHRPVLWTQVCALRPHLAGCSCVVYMIQAKEKCS